MLHPLPRPMIGPDWPWGVFAPDELDQRLDDLEMRIVTGTPLIPAEFDDARYRRWRVDATRRGAGPSMQRALFETWYRSDLRPLLETIRVPTLVLSRESYSEGFAHAAEHVARTITGARLAVIPGTGAVPYLGPSEPFIEEVQEFLTGTRSSTAIDDRSFATLLFTDIVGSTERTATVGDRQWRELLDEHDTTIARELERFRGDLVKTTGDGVLATFDGPARAIRCAQALSERMRTNGIDIRAGLHAGEVERRARDVSGIAVNIARRVCDEGGAGDVLVSRTVVDLVAGADLSFDDRGEHELKGVPGRWQLYAVKR
jgi:class 3 adenylate cyclase